MVVRIASVDEMKALWAFSDSNTYKYFVDGMEKGNIEFWSVESKVDKRIIGELYIIWDSPDKDEADGKNRAYLCALRIEEPFRGQGLASKLMTKVLERIRDAGYTEVVIGVDNREYEKLKGMYNTWGFKTHLKQTHYDHHYKNKENQSTYYEEAFDLWLLKL